MKRKILARFLPLSFAFAFLLACLPLASAGDARREYVTYVLVLDAVIEGDIFDNETGEGVGGAGVGGEIHSEVIPIDVQADENGHFRVFLPSSEDHTYTLNISAVGYDPRTITGSVKSGEHKYLQIPINYNPFDLSLAENSGSLERGWNSYTYTHTVSESYTATRQAILSYDRHHIYPRWHDGGYDFYRISSYFSIPWYVYSRSDPYLYRLRVWPDRWMHFYVNFEVVRLEPYAVRVREYYGMTRAVSYNVTAYHEENVYAPRTAEDGLSIENVLVGTRQIPYTKTVTKQVPVYEDQLQRWLTGRTVYSTRQRNDWLWHDLGGWSGWLQEIKAEAGYELLLGSGWEYEPVYGSESYTAYRDVTRENTDYLLENWGERQTTVAATPRNGYEGEVHLVAEADGVQAALGENMLQFSSPASTTLTMKPFKNTSGSPHPVTIKAYDSNGRLVCTHTYDLSLSALPKPGAPTPPPSTLPSTLPSSPGTSAVFVRGNYMGYGGGLPGATVTINGTAVGTTNSAGKLYISGSLGGHIGASKSGWNSTGTFNGGNNPKYVNGVSSVTMDLHKGSFSVGLNPVLTSISVGVNKSKQINTTATATSGGYGGSWQGGYCSTSVSIPYPTTLRNGKTSSGVTPTGSFTAYVSNVPQSSPVGIGTSCHVKASNTYWSGSAQWSVKITVKVEP